MHMTLRFPTGRRAEAILLAAGPDRLRIVLRRRSDTYELRLAGGEWISERGERIEVESLIGWAPEAPAVRCAGSVGN